MHSAQAQMLYTQKGGGSSPALPTKTRYRLAFQTLTLRRLTPVSAALYSSHWNPCYYLPPNTECDAWSPSGNGTGLTPLSGT
jgi:hypothetical protein